MDRSSSALAAVLLASTGLLAGCQSEWTTIAASPPSNYEVLGPAKGSASGALLIDGTAYNFIPIGLNSRSARAYRHALESVPGATGLINVTIQESWFWFVIGSMRRTTLTGDAIKER